MLALLHAAALAAPPETPSSDPATNVDEVATASTDPTLEDARWTHRLIVVVAADPTNARVQAARAAFAHQPAAVQDRKLRLVTVLGGDVTGLDAEVATLVETWSIAPDEAFEALLIGLDGGVKARTHEGIDLEAWFARIDGMPMRARELRRRSSGE